MVEGHLGVEQKTPGQSRMQSIEKAGVTSSWDFEVGGTLLREGKGRPGLTGKICHWYSGLANSRAKLSSEPLPSSPLGSSHPSAPLPLETQPSLPPACGGPDSFAPKARQSTAPYSRNAGRGCPEPMMKQAISALGHQQASAADSGAHAIMFLTFLETSVFLPTWR